MADDKWLEKYKKHLIEDYQPKEHITLTSRMVRSIEKGVSPLELGNSSKYPEMIVSIVKLILDGTFKAEQDNFIRLCKEKDIDYRKYIINDEMKNISR